MFRTNYLFGLLLLTTLTIVSCTDEFIDIEENAVQIVQEDDFNRTGNGFPSGAHFTLNLIGMSKDKTADMTGDQGHRIFVPLDRKTRINLERGESFQVLDGNATDGKGRFQLPVPDADGDGQTTYSVYARALGKPGGSASLTTCATYTYIDELTGEEVSEEVCNTMENSVIIMREKGKSKAINVTDELLFVYADLDGDGQEEKYSLFDEALEDYLWEYNNQGLKLLQLRFYYND